MGKKHSQNLMINQSINEKKKSILGIWRSITKLFTSHRRSPWHRYKASHPLFKHPRRQISNPVRFPNLSDCCTLIIILRFNLTPAICVQSSSSTILSLWYPKKLDPDLLSQFSQFNLTAHLWWLSQSVTRSCGQLENIDRTDWTMDNILTTCTGLINLMQGYEPYHMVDFTLYFVSFRSWLVGCFFVFDSPVTFQFVPQPSLKDY